MAVGEDVCIATLCGKRRAPERFAPSFAQRWRLELAEAVGLGRLCVGYGGMESSAGFESFFLALKHCVIVVLDLEVPTLAPKIKL